MLVAERLGLEPVEHRLVLCLCDVHQRSHALLLERRLQTVEVAKLHDMTYALVVGDSLTALVLVDIAEHLRLNLHAETSAHSHVGAELQRHGARCLVVRRIGDVRSHSYRGEEVGCAPLHVDALQGVGVVARPELVEVRQVAPVDTSAARCAVLDGEVGILGAYALQSLLQSAVIVDVEVALVVGCEILRAVVGDVHVSVPLYVVDFGILRHEVVYDGEHKVLHLRVGEVEHHLRAATSRAQFALRSLDNPVGVLVVELALGVRHLRLYPYTELHAQLLSLVEQAFYAVGQLLAVHLPVAERAVVGLARILLAEPSVVHHEQFAAHRLDVCHHLRHVLLVDVKVDTLPRVEQNLALAVGVGEFVLAAPAVEVAAHSAESLLAVRERCDWRHEGLVLLQMILRVVVVDAGEELVILRLVGHGAQLVVAGVADGGADDAS